MLHCGAGTSGGRDGSSAQEKQQQQQQQFPYLVKDPQELHRSHLKLTSAQCIITKNTSDKTSKQHLQFSQPRPSVLRKGNQTLPQDLSSQSAQGHWSTPMVCKAEVENNFSVNSSSFEAKSPSTDSASVPGPRLGTAEHHHTQHPQEVLESVLCAKGVCAWPDCKKVFKESTHFHKHLRSEHRPGDKTIEQWTKQSDNVKQIENQLILEKQKLRAMSLHLSSMTSSAESLQNNPSLSLKQTFSPSGSLQAFESVTSLQGSGRVPAEMLPSGHLQIPTSQFIPGLITSIEWYKYTNIRPPFTYASMIRWAILESPEKQLTLNEIYHWFTRKFSYFRHNTATWKNAVRHNLSLHKCFVRVDGGKGSVWTVDEAEFLRRKGQKLQRDQDVSWMPHYMCCF
ncbi:forkhead box protein P3a isoform X2 [Astyanax mexicanus]|nr:forkhead box protein P3a isoform X2 [Astyanax mexicanus]XP_049341794.1 forkhead box protein P3a isoform X2 [Astyanax mexicanus]XP_049341795.1 forkhead box protein P3a isoform X2 [Astyanax mexicanus]